MCTVSIVPREDGFRLLCNRDEQRSRPLAVPPQWHAADRFAATYPIDPQGGGTWIAVNNHGVAVALLNRHLPSNAGMNDVRAAGLLRSRGEIPLRLLAARGIEDARAWALRIVAERYSPFLLLVVSFDRLLRIDGGGGRLAIDEQHLSVPMVFTSSSMGDALAERARLPLFHSLVTTSRDPWAGQRAFHDHQWATLPELSVRMRRPDACTVSRTRVDVRSDRVTLDYEPLARVS